MENITYEEFIQNILETRGRFGCGDEYHESHHIVPRCMGGEDNKENLIDLFAREHFIAHKLLAQENPDNDNLSFAWTCMAFLKNDYHKRYELTPEEYEVAKKKLSKIIAKANASRVWSEESKQKLSNTISGENHPWFGRQHTEETKRKLSEINKSRMSNPENNPMYGKHHSEDTRKKMRDNHSNVSGENNPRALILVQLDKEDNVMNVWRYTKLAAKELKICYANILSCVNGKKYKSAGGYRWKYLYDHKLQNGDIVPGAVTLGLITEEEAFRLLEQDKMINKQEENV